MKNRLGTMRCHSSNVCYLCSMCGVPMTLNVRCSELMVVAEPQQDGDGFSLELLRGRPFPRYNSTDPTHNVHNAGK